MKRLAAVLGAVALVAACSRGTTVHQSTPTTTGPTASTPATGPGSTLPGPAGQPLDIYAADRPGALSPAVDGQITRVYVPNSDGDTLDQIDPATMKIVQHDAVGKLPQHVVPSWDLQTLYVANDLGNSLTPIDPRTGKLGTPIPVDDPYNLYFTPDGPSAIVVAEKLARLDFRDPHTFALKTSLHVPCKGVDHLDFSADLTFLIASCEFAGTLVKVRIDGPDGPRVDGPPITLKKQAQPQDVKLSPDGKIFYVADMVSAGVWEIDATTMTIAGFLKTGAGAHGLYVSRDSQSLYVSNRADGSISVVDLATRTVRTRWAIPGGSPDMGGVSADGKTLWLSGRTNSEVYAIDTTTGALRGRIKVGAGPHGLCIWPQPGRYSLGHTGILR